MPANWMEQYLDAWNSHDGSRVAAFFAEDGTYENVMGTAHKGQDAVKAYVEMNHQSSSDFRMSLLNTVASDHQYAVEWEYSGTNDGEIPGFPASKRPFRLQGVSIGELDAEGKIKRSRDYWNLAEYMTQVGLLPAPGA